MLSSQTIFTERKKRSLCP